MIWIFLIFLFDLFGFFSSVSFRLTPSPSKCIAKVNTDVFGDNHVDGEGVKYKNESKSKQDVYDVDAITFLTAAPPIIIKL